MPDEPAAQVPPTFPQRETLLVAVDFSTASTRAFALALRYAVALNVDLLVLHVVHAPAADPGFYTREGDGRRQRSGGRTLVMTGGDMLDGFIAAARAAHEDPACFARVTTRHVTGTPATRIVEVAREIGASQIIMGSRGRSGWKGILLGSTAQRVIQLAPMPVTLVKAAPEDAPAALGEEPA